MGILQITKEEQELMLSRFRVMHADKDEILVREGMASNRMFFVKKGCLRIYFLQADGTEATRYIAFENNFATALMAFITQEPSLEYVQALESSELLYISRGEFYDMMNKVPGWEHFYRKYLESAYVNNTNRLMSFITMDATARYKLLLEENPAIVQRLSNKMVANYLGITQEALSRLKSKLSKG
ncbi:MAG TPA: Crp/Fnr family transcriptional regulator [Chitinophaga sp.]|uniref:Crp/Fnr family transcriptional regulator n=1 Tax=Chitinophaga sp. TaxID=1869181 RepID=UPI002C7BAB06|nr:Crp/Fnr family transcriptional regulator [Chitinophaga sp.]HVI47057.1 Crp/Fnr family transcriptional regulator [Chitinophaga sp.]